MKGLIYMSENANILTNSSAKVTREQLRNSMIHSVAEELISNTEIFTTFADVAIKDLPWKQVKDEYHALLPESLFTLEGMFSDPNGIIPEIQETLQDLGCERITSHTIYTSYGIKDVMFGRVFSPNDEEANVSLTQGVFKKEQIPAAQKLFVIAKIFQVIDAWPSTKHFNGQRKLEIATKIVNSLTNF